MSRMMRRRTTTPPFKWRVGGLQRACDYLLAAYRAEVSLRHCAFIDDAATRLNVRNVADALCRLGAPKFCIILCGDCGNGKTTMMSAIRTATSFLANEGFFNYKTPYGDVRAVDTAFRTIDAAELCMRSKLDDQTDFNAYADAPLLILEDVGQEPREVQAFGNLLYPVCMVLERRYTRCLPTFITTNLSPEQLGTHYGKRIRDRLREMSFIIPFDNPSYRR